MPDSTANPLSAADAAWAKHDGPSHRFKLVRFCDLPLLTSPAYLIKGILPREGVVVAWGPPKCGKSYWLFDALLHVTLNWEYRGRRVTQGPVVYLALEGERGLGARAAAFRRHHGIEASDDPPFYLITTRLDLVADRALLIEDIKSQIGDVEPVAVAVDTLNRSFTGSESDDRDMGAYVKAADAIGRAFNCAVILVHHCGIEGTRPRGHTSLTGAADAQLAIKRDASGAIVATVEWMKDGPEGDVIRNRLEVVEVGVDDDGLPLTSCVVVPADGETAPAAGSKVRLPDGAKIALDCLKRALADHGEAPPSDLKYPGQCRTIVNVRLWREECYRGGISDTDSQEAKQKAFVRAQQRLVAAQLVGMMGETAWLS